MPLQSRTGRSVADYDTPESLREALQSMDQKPSVPVVTTTGYKKAPIADSEIIDSIGAFVDDMDNNLDWVVDGYDKDTSFTLDLEEELRRLAVLKSYRLIGSGRNPAYERLISMVGRVMKCPIAQVGVIDLGRNHILASRGIGDVNDYPRKTSMSAHAIISKLDLLIVPDLTTDSRFKHHELVLGHPHVQFFAAAPLNCPEGYRLGTLSIMDTKARPEGLTFAEKQSFREIADMVTDVMVEYREAKNHEYRQPAQLIACTSNDLITPLRGVISGLSALQDDKELQNSLTQQQQEVINTALTCSAVMSRMCKKALQSFRDDAATVTKVGKKVTADENDDKQIMNIQELAQHLHTVMEPFPKEVPLVITIAPSVPDVVVADDLKVFRSAINYITNACAKTKKGSVHLKIYLRDDEESDDDEARYLVFSVEDTGPGISVDKYRYLFQPMVDDVDPLSSYCVDSLLGGTSSKASKAKMESSGLGLYSVATQIKSIGGKYGFRPRGFTESGSQCFDPTGQPLQGSVFWFSIPLVLPKPTKKISSLELPLVYPDDDSGSVNGILPSGEKKRTYDSASDASVGERKWRALLIEDSEVVRKIMTRTLTRLGFEVVLAANGMEGLKLLHAKLYDIVLCDYLMPVMDGIECVKQYRQFEVAHRPWFDQYIVGMSAHASEEDVERGLKAGMNDYRSKPVTLEVMQEIIESPEFQYVNSRLDDFYFDQDESADEESTKRQRLEEKNDEGSEDEYEKPVHVCLIAADTASALSNLADKISQQKSWKAVAVGDGEAALRLLQMRNWDAVLLDDELTGLTSNQCISRFREWEMNNRVNRQKNILQISSSFIPTKMETSSSVQLPAGFDGALGKPISFKILQDFLDKAQQDSESQDIIRR